MKTKITIEIETNNMNKIFDTDNPEEFNEEHNITKYVEEQIHLGIIQWIKSNLEEDTINEVLINDAVPNFEFLTVDDWDSLQDYGDLKITVEQDEGEKITLTNILNKNPNIVVEELEEPEITKEEAESDYNEEQD